eukprot:5281627-Pleurochrysis_carterae.AAC.2
MALALLVALIEPSSLLSPAFSLHRACRPAATVSFGNPSYFSTDTYLCFSVARLPLPSVPSLCGRLPCALAHVVPMHCPRVVPALLLPSKLRFWACA